MIEKFDKPTLKIVREALADALDGLQEELGIKLKIGNNISFDANTFTTKLTGSLFSHDPLAEDWKKYAHIYDLDVAWLGREFPSDGKTFTIVGLDTKKRKYPVIATRDGKRYKFPTDVVIKRVAS